MLSWLKNHISTRRFENLIFKYARDRLGRGLYLFVYSKKEVSKISFFRVRLSFIHHLHFNFSNKGTCTSFIFTHGVYKHVLVFNDYCICIPKNNLKYEKIKNNYYKYHQDIAFPYAKIVEFNDKKKMFIMERVIGSHFCDDYHNTIILNAFLEYAKIAIIHKERKEYLQHGDSKSSNIIWFKNDQYIFIDLDFVGFYPILFDFLHYCALSAIDTKAMLAYLMKNESSVRTILSNFDIEYNDFSSLDDILAGYVCFYISSERSKFKRDYLFLNDLDRNLFPRTVVLLEKLLNKK